jgi:hypothetical protein
VTSSAVPIAGVGFIRAPDDEPTEAENRARRLRATLAALSTEGTPIRLLHGIEELAVLAAHEALSRSGITMPYRGDDLGVVLGVEEGIDGIKARYYQGILKDGPLGASPLTFPLTTPNTIAARISILFDLRGETFTVGGGNIAGAQALGLAVQALRDGYSTMVLAGGVTCVEQEFLEAASLVRRSGSGRPGGGACLFLLGSRGSSSPAGGGQLLGYGEGFGANDVPDAIQACLEDAGIPPCAVGAVRMAAVCDWRSVVQAVRGADIGVGISHSPSSGLYSASFPLAVAEVAGQPASGTGMPVLVVGRDCLAGAAAAVVQGGK